MTEPSQAPLKEADDERLKLSRLASQGTGQASKPAVNAPGRSKFRPETHFAQYENADSEKMERMKAAYEQDVASGTQAPGARFVEGARNTRSGSGAAMAVNDVAESVHGVAASSVGKAVGKATAGGIGGDPAKFVASVATVTQAGAQAIDQFDSGRNAVYAQSKQVYKKSSENRQNALEGLHSLNMKESDQLTDEQRANESKILRNVWKTTGNNIAKGLKTAALAKTTGNKGELLSENSMKHTSGGQTDLAPGEIAEVEHVSNGSMYGNAKRRYNDGDSQKLSADRKAIDEQLAEHQNSLEDRRDYELKLRAPFMGMSAQAYDPKNAGDETNQFFMDEHAAKKVHRNGIADLETTAQTELGARKKTNTYMGVTISHSQELHADEEAHYAAAKDGYDSATSEAVARREAHRKKNSDTYQELHKKTPWKINKAIGAGATPLAEEEKGKKNHAKAEKTKLGTPPTLDNLKPYMTELQLAQANSHDRTMKNLESVRDTGLTLDQHDEMAQHHAGLDEIGARKRMGLSKGDREELAATEKRRAELRNSQREHDQTISDHLGEAADAQGRIGGVNQGEVKQPTIMGRIAQGGVSLAASVRTGAGMLSGKDSYARPALENGDLGTAAVTGLVGAGHQVVGAVSTAFGAPVNSEKLVAPVVGLANAGADVIQGLTGARADEEERNRVKREFDEGTRRKNTRTAPVDFVGSTDAGLAPTDHLGMFQAGLTGVDNHLRDLSPTYGAARTNVDDSVASTKETAQQSLKDMAEPLTGALDSPMDLLHIRAPEMPEAPALAVPASLGAPALDLTNHEYPKIESPQLPEAEKLTALTNEVPAGPLSLDEANLTHLKAPTPGVENESGEQDLGPEAPEQEPGASADKEEEEDEEWWSDPKEKGEDPEIKPTPAHKPKLDLKQIEAAGAKSSLLHQAVGDRAHRTGMSMKNKKGDDVSQVQHLGTDLRSQIHAAGARSTKKHEGDLPKSKEVADVTKKEYKTMGSRFNRFTRNLSLRVGNAYRGTTAVARSGILGGVRSVGRSLASGARSLLGGKARNYDDPIENRKRKEEKEQARKRM